MLKLMNVKLENMTIFYISLFQFEGKNKTNLESLDVAKKSSYY